MNITNITENMYGTSIETIIHDYAFMELKKTFPNEFADEESHGKFLQKFEAFKNKVALAFEKDPEGTMKKYQQLRASPKPTPESMNEMAYQKPNFERVWDQVKHNAFVNSMGLEKWLEVANTGKDSKISKPSLDNVLDYDPMVKAKDKLMRSHVDMPIILKTPMGDYHLLSGNSVLKGIMNIHGNAKVWYIDASQETANEM